MYRLLSILLLALVIPISGLSAQVPDSLLEATVIDSVADASRLDTNRHSLGVAPSLLILYTHLKYNRALSTTTTVGIAGYLANRTKGWGVSLESRYYFASTPFHGWYGAGNLSFGHVRHFDSTRIPFSIGGVLGYDGNLSRHWVLGTGMGLEWYPAYHPLHVSDGDVYYDSDLYSTVGSLIPAQYTGDGLAVLPVIRVNISWVW